MPSTPIPASLYQIYTRTYLYPLSRQLGRPATLDDIPDTALDRLAEAGFEWIYLLGAWETGRIGRRISLENQPLRRELERVVPDLKDEDIASSCFAIARYRIHSDFGGDEALARLRERMAARGLRLMLDFVPNHTAIDHYWVWDYPDYFVYGSDQDLAERPHDYVRVPTAYGDWVLAHGKDPYFPSWIDTLQFDYSNPEAHQAMRAKLLDIATRCDGVRCDMAMLVLPDVFQKVWGRSMQPFWEPAIQQVRAVYPDFTFLAEVYWNREWELQEQGFDYTYDKLLYDALMHRDPRWVTEHLSMDPGMLGHMAHFLENHDEPRAAERLPLPEHRAAAVLTYLAPGLRFFQHGQLEGWRMRVPMQLARPPLEQPNPQIAAMYQRLLGCLRHPALCGQWSRMISEPSPISGEPRGQFIGYQWLGLQGERLWVVVNYSANPGGCALRLPDGDLTGGRWQFNDLLETGRFEFDGDELANAGLQLELPGWAAHIFELSRI
ncbi:MAG: alpha-amylase family glycosyl hydrolase [Chloroflexota bacterium]